MTPRQRHTCVCVLCALLLIVVVQPAHGQERGDVTAIGMARSTVSIARGISSIYTNPGSIALDRLGPRDSTRPIEVELAGLPMGIAAGATYLNQEDFEFIFSDKDCGVFSDEDRRRLYGLLAPDRMSVDAAVDIAAVRLRVPGIVAVAVQYGHRVRARMNFPEAFRADVLGTGDVYAGGRTYAGADVGGEWIKRFGMTIGGAWERDAEWPPQSVWLPAIGGGVSAALLEGIAHFDVAPESFVRTTALAPGPAGLRRLDVGGYYSFRTSAPDKFEPSDAIIRPGFSAADSTRAEGWGMGIGISAVIYRTVHTVREVVEGTPLDPEHRATVRIVARDAVLFGIAADEIGSLRWKGPNLRRARVLDTIVTEQRGGLTYEVLCGYRGELDTVGAFTSALPGQIRLGAGVDITAFVPLIGGDMFGSIEAAFDLNDAIGSERAARFSAGLSYSPWSIVTLSTGVQFGGRRGAAWALGAAVSPFPWISLEAATSDWTGLVGATVEYDLAFRAELRFSI